jgi:hypothetical protein
MHPNDIADALEAKLPKPEDEGDVTAAVVGVSLLRATIKALREQSK